MCSELLCTFSNTLKSLALELFVYKLHSNDCMVKSKSVDSSELYTAHIGTLVITLGHTSHVFSAQGCHLVVLNSTILLKRCMYVAGTLAVMLTAPFSSLVFVFYLIRSMV